MRKIKHICLTHTANRSLTYESNFIATLQSSYYCLHFTKKEKISYVIKTNIGVRNDYRSSQNHRKFIIFLLLCFLCSDTDFFQFLFSSSSILCCLKTSLKQYQTKRTQPNETTKKPSYEGSYGGEVVNTYLC